MVGQGALRVLSPPSVNFSTASNGRTYYKVNKQDFLQVFQGSGIGNIEDNLTSNNNNNDDTCFLGSL